jgi:hypothetical protein
VLAYMLRVGVVENIPRLPPLLHLGHTFARLA